MVSEVAYGILQIVAIGMFNFEQWETWIRRFKIASGLKSKMDEEQVSTLNYSLGDKQICYNLSICWRRIQESNNIIMTKFSSASQGHFDKSRNTICE